MRNATWSTETSRRTTTLARARMQAWAQVTAERRAVQSGVTPNTFPLSLDAHCGGA